MLGKFIKINNTVIPNPNSGTFKSNMNPNETEYFTENGIRKTIPKRLERFSWSAEFNCTSTMRATLKAYCNLPRVSCIINGTTYQGTLRTSGDETLVENSEYTAGTDGLWVIPLTFQSF